MPLASQGFNATGLTLTPLLNFAPSMGTQLTLVNNTAAPAGSNPIQGTFTNLAPGGTISATYAGTTYNFQANYGSGGGNDLVLTAVTAVMPSITWANPASISYGTALSSTQLDATASVAGTFAYSPPLGTVLSAGNDTISVIFTPSDTNDFSTAIGSVSINVSPVTPTITWSNPASISFGTALSGTQLDATASVAGTSPTVLPWEPCYWRAARRSP